MAGLQDYLFKLVMVGEMSVGKTSILLRYTDNIFDGIYKSTIGCDFKIKNVDVNGRHVSLQIWDTSGQERFKSLASSFYRNADGLIIVFDVTCMDSFLSVEKWLRDAEYFCGKRPIKERILIGNKTDKDDERVVSLKQAQKCAQSLGMTYIETSAKDNKNVTRAFDSMTHRMLDSQGYAGWMGDMDMGDVIKLDDNAMEVEGYSGYCCSYF